MDRAGVVAAGRLEPIVAGRLETSAAGCTSVPGDDAALRSPHAEGCNQAGTGGPLVDTTLYNPTAADAAGALVTTPADLARF